MKAIRATLLALAAAVVAVVWSVRRWARAIDPSDGPLEEPEGTSRIVQRPDGVALQVMEAGDADGPLVVLSHCWAGDSRVWGPVARQLVQAGARVVRYDHRGHGRSTLVEVPFTLDALADDLAAVIETLPERPLVLAGHSMGGMAAQALLGRHPELARRRVAGLALVATAADDMSPGPRRSARMVSLVGAPAQALLQVPVLGSLLMRMTVGRQVCGAHISALITTFLASSASARAELLASIHAMDLREGLAQHTNLPTTIVVGRWDVLTPLSSSKRMAAVLPQAQLVVLPQAGHMLPWERPNEVTQVLLDLVPTDGDDALRLPINVPIDVTDLEQAL